jgi:hypothetical protein
MNFDCRENLKSYRPPHMKFSFLFGYIVQDFSEVSCGIFCVSPQYTRERSEGNMENCQDSLQALQSIRAKRGGAGYRIQ